MGILKKFGISWLKDKKQSASKARSESAGIRRERDAEEKAQVKATELK